MTTDPMRLPIKFAKPPFRIFGITFCKHVWKEFWKPLSPNDSVLTEKCARCLKEKSKKGGML